MSGSHAGPLGGPARRVTLRALAAVAGFLAYAMGVWLMPVPAEQAATGAIGRDKDRRAIHAWRAAGCQVCHSVYGLGGHIGPDLTGIMRRRSGGYVRAMMMAGPTGMPSYRDLGQDQIDAIVAYLSIVNPPTAYPSTRWIEGGEETPE